MPGFLSHARRLMNSTGVPEEEGQFFLLVLALVSTQQDFNLDTILNLACIAFER